MTECKCVKGCDVTHDRWCPCNVDDHFDALAALRAENAKLREALERVIDEAYKPGFLDIARDALEKIHV